MLDKIGITERADPTINLKWQQWVKDGKPAILITKMPRLLYPMLTGKENVIIHCTITGMGGSPIEPKIDDYKTSLEYYHKFCDLFGKDRVVLRIDPILMEGTYIAEVFNISNETEGRVRISFMDLYPHVKTRFAQAGLKLAQDSFHQSIVFRSDIWRKLGKPEVCAEPDLPVTPCVSIKDCEILGVNPSPDKKGQRELCGCLANKTELCTLPPKCTYGCLYCYWKG